MPCQALDLQSKWVSKDKSVHKPAQSSHCSTCLTCIQGCYWLHLINSTNLHLIARYFWDISKEHLFMLGKGNSSAEYLKLVALSCLNPCAPFLCSKNKTGSQFVCHLLFLKNSRWVIVSFKLNWYVLELWFSKFSSTYPNVLGLLKWIRYTSNFVLITVLFGKFNFLTLWKILSFFNTHTHIGLYRINNGGGGFVL